MYDFLNAVEPLNSAFAATARTVIYNKMKERTLPELLEEFRNIRRVTKAKQNGESHSAFPTFKGDNDATEKADSTSPSGPTVTSNANPSGNTSNGDVKKTKKDNANCTKHHNCVCGSPFHPIDKCYYLNEAIRPTGWQPKEGTLKAIQQRIANNPTLAATVDKIRQSSQGSQGTTDSANGQKPVLGVFTAAYSASNGTYKLKDKWILDSGSDIHICNSLNGFSRTEKASQSDQIISGKATYQIESFRTMNINVNSP